MPALIMTMLSCLWQSSLVPGSALSVLSLVVDGSNVINGLNGNFGFSAADRSETIRRNKPFAKNPAFISNIFLKHF